MKTRQELQEDADKQHLACIKYIENEIAFALSKGLSSIDYHCNEDVYNKLKSEIESSGFRTKFMNVKSRLHTPYMIIYL